MSAPMEPFESQNKTDDDAAVIDSFFIETNAPPDIKAAMEYRLSELLREPPIYGRLITGSAFLTLANTAPQQILPADTKRKSVTLSVLSTAGTPTAFPEYVFLSDENGRARPSGQAYNLRHGKDPLVLSGYTGPLYVAPNVDITAGIEVTWIAVTE